MPEAVEIPAPVSTVVRSLSASHCPTSLMFTVAATAFPFVSSGTARFGGLGWGSNRGPVMVWCGYADPTLVAARPCSCHSGLLGDTAPPNIPNMTKSGPI
ncbi:hypothetical protein JCM3263A_25450 [Thermobifida fusca]